MALSAAGVLDLSLPESPLVAVETVVYVPEAVVVEPRGVVSHCRNVVESEVVIKGQSVLEGPDPRREVTERQMWVGDGSLLVHQQLMILALEE